MNNEIPAAPAHHDSDNDRVLDPALGAVKPRPSGSPGNVQTGSGATSVMGAGGRGGTGLIGQPAAEDEAMESAATSGVNAKQ